MSHHRRIAREQLAVAIDQLEAAEALLEDQGSPTARSLEVEQPLVRTRAAVYHINAADWRGAELALVQAVAEVSHLALGQAAHRRELHERGGEDREHAIRVTGPAVDQLVHARRAIRKAILNLRLSKDRPT
jgi:hypothetical protein